MTISSPCIRLCVLDDEAGLCLGCGRTRDEIAGWIRMSEEQRRTLMASLPARLSALAPAADASGVLVQAGDD